MSLDLKKMKEKQAVLQGGGKQGNANFWTAPDGNSVIRFLPSPDGDPFKEHFLHYGLAKAQGFLCPKRNFGEDCRVCEFVAKLYKGGEDEKKTAANIKAKARYFSTVVVRGEEDDGVKIWSYSKTIYDKLLSLALNPDYGDFTDVDGETGLDFDLSKVKKPKEQFATIDLTPKRKNSPLSTNAAFAAEWLSTNIEWDKLFERKTTAETAQILDEHLNPKEQKDESTKPEGGDESPQPSPAVPVSTSKKNPRTKSVEDSIKELKEMDDD